MMPGWSSYGGQTQSAYVEGGIVEGELILGHSVSLKGFGWISLIGSRHQVARQLDRQ